MTWRAFATGGSGNYAHSWSGTGGLSGTDAIVTKQYSAKGYKEARVEVTDINSGDRTTADCAMHVIPSSFSEPPSVTPILWVPRGVDPSPMVPFLERVWRSIHALFQHFYGKTFRMKPLRTIVSTKTEADICGGDCADLGMNFKVIDQANVDADRLIAPTIPYTRARLIMAWGGGGWAGGLGWFYAGGAVGDYAIAPAVGVQTPSVQQDLPDFYASILGDYRGALYSTIAHELNHVIAWDDPHDFSLENPPNTYERAVSLAGPFLTQTLADTTEPTVDFASLPAGSTLSKTAVLPVNAVDDVAMDAVVLLVDGKFAAIDTTRPFSLNFDTRLVGQGRHTLTAIAYDKTGNMATVSRDIFVANRLDETSCERGFPAHTFHVCYFDGIGFRGPYLGAFVDHPFPSPAPNAGWGVNHPWGADPVAFGQSETISGVWRGTLNFPAGNYQFHFFTDDGLRVFIDGRQVVNEWRDQVAEFTRVVALDGRTKIRVQWYQDGGGRLLRFWWLPTSAPPSAPAQ